MVQLNRDVLYLISKELQYDKETIYSCLYVSKTWCEIFVSRLWENPWEFLGRGKEKLLLNVIASHLSDESREKINNLISLRNNSYRKPLFNFISFCNSYRKPLFNYIIFCKHLNIVEIERIIAHCNNRKKFIVEIQTITYEISKLFINENRRITHLYIYRKESYNKIRLIPGAKHCFSKLQFLSCNINLISDDLAEICESINELELLINKYNHKIVEFIKTPKKLLRICLMGKSCSEENKSFYTVLENSLMLHSDNIQYYESNIPPVTDILSSFVNLKVLELRNMYFTKRDSWNCLENLSIPLLQILRTKGIPPEYLISIIENSRGDLIEIKLDKIPNLCEDKLFIQTVKLNYPNLKLFYNKGEASKNLIFITPSADEKFRLIARNLSDIIIESNISERLQLLNVAFESSNSRGTNRTKFLFNYFHLFNIMLIFFLPYLFKPFLFIIVLIFFLLYLFKPFLFIIMLILFLFYIFKPFLFIIMLISFIFYLFKH
jgi:hypothetical protein